VSVHSLHNAKLTNEYNAHIGAGQESINIAATR
jgi:hypothetical protein